MAKKREKILSLKCLSVADSVAESWRLSGNLANAGYVKMRRKYENG